MDYNEKGQLLSVTALNPYTLTPLYYETVKMDRIYKYSDSGKLTNVWASYNYFFELEYSGDGKSATAVATKSDERIELNISFYDNGIIKKEEYSSNNSENLSIVFEYDVEGKRLSFKKKCSVH